MATEVKYCVRTPFSSYVKSFQFSSDGVYITFTTNIDEAAKVSVKAVAEYLAKCSGGKAIKCPK